MWPTPEPERRLVVIHPNGLHQILGTTTVLDRYRLGSSLVLDHVTPRAVYYRPHELVGALS